MIYNLKKAMHKKEMARGNTVLDRAQDARHLANEIDRCRITLDTLECLPEIEAEIHAYINKLHNRPALQDVQARKLFKELSALKDMERQAKRKLPALIAHSDIYSGLVDAGRAA